MHSDENNGVFIFDFGSPKTKKALELVAEELIRDVKGILLL
jgi:hypothetical protein